MSFMYTMANLMYLHGVFSMPVLRADYAHLDGQAIEKLTAPQILSHTVECPPGQYMQVLDIGVPDNTKVKIQWQCSPKSESDPVLPTPSPASLPIPSPPSPSPPTPVPFQVGEGCATLGESVGVETAPAVGVGRDFSMVLAANGTVYVTGRFGGKTTRTPYERLRGVKSMVVGPDHALYIMHNDVLCGDGMNTHGQLGDGTNTFHIKTPIIVMTGVKAIATTMWYSLFLKSNGDALFTGHWAMGTPPTHYTVLEHITPVLIKKSVKAIAAGTNTAVFIDVNNSAYIMGEDTWNQFGLGSRYNQSGCKCAVVPVPIHPVNGLKKAILGDSVSFWIDQQDALYWNGHDVDDVGFWKSVGWSRMIKSPVKILDNVLTVSIPFQSKSTFYLLKNKTLLVAGKNAKGQMGIPDAPTSTLTKLTKLFDNVTACAMGEYHSIALVNSSVLVVGTNRFSQLGDGSQQDRTHWGELFKL